MFRNIDHRRNNNYPPRHAQVDMYVATIEVEDDIFATAGDIRNAATDHILAELVAAHREGDLMPQRLKRFDGSADHLRPEVTNDSFYFGEFGHVGKLGAEIGDRQRLLAHVESDDIIGIWCRRVMECRIWVYRYQFKTIAECIE